MSKIQLSNSYKLNSTAKGIEKITDKTSTPRHICFGHHWSARECEWLSNFWKKQMRYGGLKGKSTNFVCAEAL